MNRQPVSATKQRRSHEATFRRKRTLDLVGADRILVTGMHLPFAGIGHVTHDGDAYRFVPAELP